MVTGTKLKEKNEGRSVAKNFLVTALSSLIELRKKHLIQYN